MTNLKSDFQDMRTLNEFLHVLEVLPLVIEKFATTQWVVPETKTNIFKALPGILKQEEMLNVPGLFNSEKLANDYQTGIAELIGKLKQYITKF